MDCLADSIGHPGYLLVSIHHIPNNLRNPDRSNQKQYTLIWKVQLLNKSAHYERNQVHSQLHTRNILILSHTLRVVVHCLYLQLKDQHPVLVNQKNSELEDERKLERKTKAPGHQAQLEVDHEHSEVADEDQTVSDVAKLVCVARHEVTLELSHIQALVVSSVVLFEFIHRVVD